MNKNNKGFTLVELCVVMALVAIVFTVSTGFILAFKKGADSVDTHVNVISDITEVNKFIEKWVRNYDSTVFEIKCDGNFLRAEYTDDKNENYGKENSLTINNGVLVWMNNGEEYQKMYPAKIDSLEFEYKKLNAVDEKGNEIENNSVITCIMRYGSNWEAMNYTVFSATVRSRFSPKDRY